MIPSSSWISITFFSGAAKFFFVLLDFLVDSFLTSGGFCPILNEVC